MGIVNVTPDSFSDGGRFLDPSAAVDHGLRLVDEGADLLDVGGESTRPYSVPVSLDEELRRTIPVIRELARQTKTPISIDTYKAELAREAIDAGAQVINDVTALTGDPRMLDVALESQAAACLMHMQGTPQTMQVNPLYADVVGEIKSFLASRRDEALAAGLDRKRICLDPGIGFGKSHEHNIELLRAIDSFHQLRCPLLVGHSRKGFLARLIGNKERDRAAATIGVSIAMALQGVHVLRVHDVQATVDALTTFFASWSGNADGQI
jgi:dihydropteroate synthase